jgi:hypothetical protein
MKYWIFIPAFFTILYSGTYAQQMKHIRTLYYQATVDEKALQNLRSELSKHSTSTTYTIDGYVGMAHMLQAQYSWNPYTKLNSFNKGKMLLDNTISKDKNNVELRFLRFCTQLKSPAFLGYTSQIDLDRKFLLNSWQALTDADLKSRIKDFFITEKACTEIEKRILN